MFLITLASPFCCNFVYPSAWIVSVPTSTGNGESGTVSANDYVKGDSAVVCALPLEVTLNPIP